MLLNKNIDEISIWNNWRIYNDENESMILIVSASLTIRNVDEISIWNNWRIYYDENESMILIVTASLTIRNVDEITIWNNSTIATVISVCLGNNYTK